MDDKNNCRKVTCVENEKGIPNDACKAKDGAETECVYEYLKSNPSLLAGIGSVMVVLLSTFINMCSYAYDCAMLRYWNVDLSYIKIDTPSRIQGTVAAVLFICIFFISQLALESLAKKANILGDYGIYLKHLRKISKKELAKNNRKAKKRRQGVTVDESLKTIAKNRESIILDRQSEYEETNRLMRKKGRGTIILLWFLLAISIYVWLVLREYSMGREHIDTYWAQPVAAMLVSIIVILLTYATNRSPRKNRKSKKKKAQSDYEIGLIESVPSSNIPSSSLQQFVGKNFRFTDATFIRTIQKLSLVTVLLVFFMVLFFIVWGISDAHNQTSLMVTTRDETQYAVIYNNGDVAVLVRCEKEEDKDQGKDVYKIDVSKQMVVSVENLEYEVVGSISVRKGPLNNESTDKAE